MRIHVPPIKCQGIKTKLVPTILRSIDRDPDGLWIEPFLGSAVVALNVDRRLAEGLGVTPAPPRPLALDQTEVQPVSAALTLESYQEEAPAVAARLERTLQAIDQVHSDGELPPIPVLPTSRDGDAVSVPGDLIGVDPADPTPELSLAHEVGHQLDWLLRGEGADMADLIAVISDTTQSRRLRDLRDDAEDAGKTDLLALLDEIDDIYDHEKFARAYAQYIAWRSGDEPLLSQIDADLAADSYIVPLRQWPYAEFLPIALQFDMLFERVGWLKRT